MFSKKTSSDSKAKKKPSMPVPAPVAKPSKGNVGLSDKIASSSSSVMKDAVEARDNLRNEWNKGERGRNMDLISKHLEIAKLKLTSLKYLERHGQDIPPSEQTLARDILEIGAMYSIFKPEPDVPLFERYLSQLKTYYLDYGQNIPASPHMYEMLGTNLLCLLSENRLAEFHTELARVLYPIEKSAENLENVFIKRAVELERALEEGRYGQIHAQDGPQKKSGLWRFFIERLVAEARLEIAETMECAYDKLSKKAVMDRLNFKNTNELEGFAKQRKWKLQDDGVYCFEKEKDDETVIPAERLLKESLDQARELEIII